MKNILLPVLSFLLAPVFAGAQAVSINTDGSNPDPSAILDVKSSDKGVLVPRMTTAQRGAITAANALLVFDSDTKSFWFFDGTAAAWREIRSGNTATLQDADGNTKVQVEKNPNEDMIRFDLGGTENMVLRKNAADMARLELKSPLANTFLGENAGQNTANGEGNTANGWSALFGNTAGARNTAVGKEALYTNNLGNDNTATGNNALYANTGGDNNTANGRSALHFNTVGSSNVGVGFRALYNNTGSSNLVAVGDEALSNNGVGASQFFHAMNNTAVGSKALFANTTGSQNTAGGYRALYANTGGRENTAHGSIALYSNTTGSENTANGVGALYSNTTGSDNTANGVNALHSNTTGVENTANGVNALYSNTSGNENTANGVGALYSNTTGFDNTANGMNALYSNTMGFDNTANGMNALYSNTTGNYNTANGRSSLYANTTGGNNTANGVGALFSNTEGNFNTANGKSSLYSNTLGDYNTATGGSALLSNTEGSFNTANGLNALTSNTIGEGNTANGEGALGENTSGRQNTALGRQALASNVTGHYNTAIGAYSDVGSGNLIIATAIGYSASVGCSYCMALGGTGVNAVKVGIGTATPELKLHVVGGSDAGLASGGYLQTGPSSGTNIVMDDNEIMARNNGAVAGLSLNNNGGNVKIGSASSLVGIGRSPATNALEVEGTASKSAAGSWVANSDARLKKNITPLNSAETLGKLLALRGVTYEWNDDKTGSKRPEGIQYGFTAQNIRTVFPTLVEEDKLGYLQTAYGTYDAMTVEAIRALHDKISALEAENARQKTENAEMKNQLEKITAALQTAGIGVENEKR